MGVGRLCRLSWRIMLVGIKFVVFASYPAGTVFEDFFLPDWDNLFDAINRCLTSLKGVFSVR